MRLNGLSNTQEIVGSGTETVEINVVSTGCALPCTEVPTTRAADVYVQLANGTYSSFCSVTQLFYPGGNTGGGGGQIP